MSIGTLSFLAWTLIMIGMVGAVLLAGRRDRRIRKKVEENASKALPEIGEIANACHKKRFGKESDAAPKNGESWYPELKKKATPHV